MSVLKKKVEVVMFTTNEKAENCLVGLGKAHLLPFKHNYYYTQSYLNEKNLSVFHLYFLSLDEKPKVGDWYVVELWNVENNTSLHLEQVKTIDDIWINNSSIDTTRHINNCKKVIATTDKSLIIPVTEEVLHTPSGKYSDEEPYYMISTHMKSLPQPDDSFIISYIKAFNKGNPIKFVMVDYGIKWTNFQDDESESYLKVDKNNIITITRCKNSWSREELQKLFDSYGDNFAAKIIWEDILKL